MSSGCGHVHVADALAGGRIEQAPDGNADQSKVEAFGRRLLDVLNGAGLSLMISLGHRSGLFDVMSRLPAVTSEALATAAGLDERYVREWLGAMTTGGIVEHDAAARTFRLPAEHAALLTRAAVPNNFAASMQFIAVLGNAEDRVLQAFRDGKGVPYPAYPRFHEVMAEESAQTVLAGLEDHILPLVEGLRGRLERGIDVLDVGCGSGRAINKLAGLFPASRFVGYDMSEEGIGNARREAGIRRLSNARFEVRDAAKLGERSAYDLITAFDAIHDQARPDLVLAGIRAALRPGGVFLMQDIGACTRVHDNLGHPMGPYLYTISCMHCMSVSLAAGGMGLGAVWGKEKALEMLAAAGFGDVHVTNCGHDQLNNYYLCRA